MREQPLVTIIILNWNGWRDTIACVETCRRLTWPNFRILVVDNGSNDGSGDILHKSLPDLEIIQTGANLGFAGGNNAGIRRALGQGTEFIWLLNNDAIVDPEALTMLVETMNDNKDAGIAGSKVYFHDQPRMIWSAGGAWSRGRLRLRQRGAYQIDNGQYDADCRLDSLSGCSMLVRSSMIEKIGVMDENYFLYWEDTDWCARALKSGYEVVFASGSHIWHKVSAGAGQHSELQYYYYTRNGLHFCRKYDCLSLALFVGYVSMDVFAARLRGNRDMLRGFSRGIRDFIRGRMGYRFDVS